MKIQKYLSKVAKLMFLPGAILAVFFGISLPQSAHADERPIYRLQISPTQDNIGTMQPGDTYSGKFNVQNTGTKPYQYTVEVTPFSVKGSNYEQDFETVSDYTVMTDWITLVDTSGSVEPDTESPVSYSIQIPDDAPAGLQAVAIIVTMTNTDEMQASGIQTVSRTAFPIYLNVDGETRREAEIISHKVPGFSFAPIIVTTSTVNNKGNIYTNAEYRLEVRNFFNDQLEYTNVKTENGVEKPAREVIFPDSERYVETSWDDAPMIGVFKVKSIVKIFDEESIIEKTVIICPLWLLILILVIVAVAIFWIVSRILRRKQQQSSIQPSPQNYGAV